MAGRNDQSTSFNEILGHADRAVSLDSINVDPLDGAETIYTDLLAARQLFPKSTDQEESDCESDASSVNQSLEDIEEFIEADIAASTENMMFLASESCIYTQTMTDRAATLDSKNLIEQFVNATANLKTEVDAENQEEEAEDINMEDEDLEARERFRYLEKMLEDDSDSDCVRSAEKRPAQPSRCSEILESASNAESLLFSWKITEPLLTAINKNVDTVADANSSKKNTEKFYDLDDDDFEVGDEAMEEAADIIEKAEIENNKDVTNLEKVKLKEIDVGPDEVRDFNEEGWDSDELIAVICYDPPQKPGKNASDQSNE